MSKKIFIIENYDEEKNTEGKFQFERYTIPWEPYWFYFSTKLANILEVFCTITLIDNLDIFI